jgi:ABC-type transporter Mla subunit MlaD
MNKKRRERIRYASALLEEAGGIIEACSDEESDSLSNLEGTSLEYTDRYNQIEEAVDNLQDAFDKIGEANELLMNSIC